MNSLTLFSLKEYCLETPKNYEEIIELCSMVPVKNEGRRNRRNRNNQRPKKTFIWREDDPLTKSLNYILNKLAIDNLEHIGQEILRLLTIMDNYKDHQEYVLHDLFSRGLRNINLIPLYTKLFDIVVTEKPDLKEIIVSLLEYLFYTKFHEEHLSGVCLFVGQLYEINLIHGGIVRFCLDILLDKKKYIEYCDLLSVHLVLAEYYAYYEEKIQAMLVDHTIPNKIKFRLMDIVEKV